MGLEKYIVLDNKRYDYTIDLLYQAFQVIGNQYTLIKDRTGFTLCGDDTCWPEIMQISVDTAHQMDFAVRDGEKYIYCLFHIGGNKEDELLQIIKNTIDQTGVNYIMDDL